MVMEEAVTWIEIWSGDNRHSTNSAFWHFEVWELEETMILESRVSNSRFTES
jgi:hypothetical protein